MIGVLWLQDWIPYIAETSSINDERPVLQLYTWAPSRRDSRLNLFQHSAQRWGFRTNVILCHSTDDKPATLSRTIEALPDDAIILCTDAFDVLFVGPWEGALTGFKAYGKPIVFGSERVCFHHLRSSRVFFEADTSGSPYIYLNSGAFIGYAGPIKAMLSAIASWDHVTLEEQFRNSSETRGIYSDQTMFGHYAAAHPEIVGLDTGAKLCWNISGEYNAFDDNMNIVGGRVEHPATKAQPCLIHVTQVRKYYPTFLSIALRLDLPLNARTVDIRLFDDHLNQSVAGIDAHVVRVRDDLRMLVQSSARYRFMKVCDSVRTKLKRLRMELGKKRRILFRMDP